MDTFVLLVRRIRAGVGARVSRRVVSRRDMTGSWRGLRWEGMTLVLMMTKHVTHFASFSYVVVPSPRCPDQFDLEQDSPRLATQGEEDRHELTLRFMV